MPPSLNQASFDLEPVESVDTTGGELDREGLYASDVGYTAHGVAADYIGDRLVELHFHVEDHMEERWYPVEYSPPDGEPYTETEYIIHYTAHWFLETNSGWKWDTADRRRSVDTASDQASSAILERGIVYIDLRFEPPVVAYEETQFHDSLDSSPLQTEKLSWSIAGGAYDVSGERNVPSDELAVFRLRRPGFPYHLSGLYSWGPSVLGGGMGTFAVGGPSTDPHVIAAHRTPTFQSNFMYPAGDLSAFGGGPVGH